MLSWITLQDAEALARGLNKQKERIVEAEQHHEKAVTEWHRQELLLKGEITALSATKARNLAYIKELDTKAVKQKEVLHDQVSVQECDVKHTQAYTHMHAIIT